MSSTSPRHGARRRLTTGAAAVCLGLTALSTPSALAADASGPDRAAVATADLTLAGSDSVPTRPAPQRADTIAQADARTAARGKRAGTRSLSSTQGTVAAANCPSLGFQANQLRDRTWLVWQAPAGATGNATVSRLREGSSVWSTVGAVPAVSGALLDRRQSPAGPAAYRIQLVVNGETWTCDMTDSTGTVVTGLSMFPDAGPGVPDFAVATSATASLQMQNDMSLGAPVNPASAPTETATPAFSPDGQWLAFSRFTSGTASDMVVQRADGSGAFVVVAASTRSTTATINAEPSFSPDGHYLAWTRYRPSGSDLLPTDIQIRDMLTGSIRTLNLPYAAPTWTRDGASLVVADLAGTGGLRRITVASGAVTGILSGTAGGYDPTVTRSGQVVFAAIDAAGSATIKTRSSAADSATVTTRYTASAGSAMSNPRVAPHDGTIYMRMDTDPDGTPGTGDEYTGIYRLATGSQTPEMTTLGSSAADTTTVGTSFDLRQAPDKGTSDFNGDGYNDLIAKDSSGNLWLYPNSRVEGRPAQTRTLLGGGWGPYSNIIAAGDMDMDGNADIIARDSGGVLWIYPTNGAGKFLPRARVGAGWGGYGVVGVGDWDHDTRADVLARDGAGVLWLYRGRGRLDLGGNTFWTRVSQGSNWNSMSALVGIGDANYDNNPDLLTRVRATGQLRLYAGRGDAAYGFLPAPAMPSDSFAGFSQFVGPQRYTSYATSLEVLDGAGQLIDVVFTGDGTLAWPYSQTTVAGGASPYLWIS